VQETREARAQHLKKGKTQLAGCLLDTNVAFIVTRAEAVGKDAVRASLKHSQALESACGCIEDCNAVFEPAAQAWDPYQVFGGSDVQCGDSNRSKDPSQRLLAIKGWSGDEYCGADTLVAHRNGLSITLDLGARYQHCCVSAI